MEYIPLEWPSTLVTLPPEILLYLCFYKIPCLSYETMDYPSVSMLRGGGVRSSHNWFRVRMIPAYISQSDIEDLPKDLASPWSGQP